MVKIFLKKSAFDVENPEEFLRIANAQADKEDEYFNRLLIPTNHVPLDRVLRTKFQALFNKVQEEVVDQDLHDKSIGTWNVCRDASYQVKRAMRDWLIGLDNGTLLTNIMILGMFITAAALFGILIGRGL